MKNIVEQSKHLVLAQHPKITVTWAVEMTSLLGNAFPPGTRSVMITAGETAWHVFWYQEKHLILSETEMQTTSVGDVKQRLMHLS